MPMLWLCLGCTAADTHSVDGDSTPTWRNSWSHTPDRL